MLLITKPNGDKKFYCPGCKLVHKINNKWRLSGTTEKPTVSPKILSVTFNFEKQAQTKCKVEIKDGIMIYDNEVTTHELKGKTIPMEQFPQLEDKPVYATREETNKVAEPKVVKTNNNAE